jgi:transcription antitermination factor NusG
MRALHFRRKYKARDCGSPSAQCHKAGQKNGVATVAILEFLIVELQMEFLNLESYWVAVHVQPRRERLVSLLLRNKGYEEFLPTYRGRSRRTGRLGKVDAQGLPLFPGYLFCRFEPNNLNARIVTTPGVLRILGTPGKPSEVPSEQILALRSIEKAKAICGPFPFLEIGEKVQIANGSLAGITGILTRTGGQRQLVISVEILRRAVSVHISAENVVPLRA